MAIYTLRPNLDYTTTGVSLSSGVTSANQATSDNNDATRVNFLTGGGLVKMGLTDLPALAAGENVARVRVVVRFSSGNGTTSTWVNLSHWDDQALETSPDYWAVNASGGPHSYIGAWLTVPPGGLGAWSPAKVNTLTVSIRDDDAGSTSPQLAEVYVDVETNVTPTVTVTAPVNNSTVDNTMQPTISATYADTENDPLTAYEVKVFTSAQYLAFAFDPSTSAPLWTTGIVESSGSISAKPVSPAALFNDTTHRAYVRARQGGVLSQWSPWAYSQFAISVRPPATPSMTAVADEANDRHILTLQDYQNFLTIGDASFEEATGWTNVARCTPTRIAYGGGDGDWALDMLATSAGTMQAGSPLAQCEASRLYSAQVHFFGVSTSRSCRVDISFYGGGGATNLLTTVTGAATAVSGNVIGYCSATAPAGTVYARVVATVLSVASGEHYYIDDVSLVPATSSGSFAWTRGGLVTSARFEVQRSLDGGATWTKLDRLYALHYGTDEAWRISDLSTIDYSDTTQRLVVYDYEAPRGVSAQYKVRVKVTLDGSALYSGFSPTATATLVGSGWRLKSVADPSHNLKINVHSVEFSTRSAERMGVFQPLGRRNPVVMADVVGGETGQLELAFLDQASFDAFEALRATRGVKLLQTPYGMHAYVQLGAQREASFMLNNGGTPKRVVTIPFIEVDP